MQHRPALLDVLHAALRGYTGEQARALLERHQVVVGVVRDYRQVERSADVLASGLLMRVGDGLGGELALPGLPFTMAGLPPTAMPSVPRLGEHTAAVLRELGYDNATIRTMAQARAIAVESLDMTEAGA
ncbi:Formyl-coenzyme A transferase [compost metagenome]